MDRKLRASLGSIIFILLVLTVVSCEGKQAVSSLEVPARVERQEGRTSTGAKIEAWRAAISFGDGLPDVKAKLGKVFPNVPIRGYEADKEMGGTSSLIVDVPSNLCSDLGIFFSFDEDDKLVKVAYSATRCSYREGPTSQFFALYGEPVGCYEQKIVGTVPHEPIERRCVWIDRDADLYVELKTWSESVDIDGGPLNAHFRPLASTEFDIAAHK